MDPISLALVGGGMLGGLFGAKSKNKKLKGLSDPFPQYSGYKPPHVEHLRPVEKMITDTVMRRSQGQDVGYDPARRQALLDNFNIEQGRDLDERKVDLDNRLSGMGLSRNAAAYDELVGRELRDAQREKNLYTNKVDIEDLGRRNEERDINTARLQDLNTFNFGQENNAAQFDLDVYNAESGNERARRGLQAQQADMYEDPFGSALISGANLYSGVNDLQSGRTLRNYDFSDPIAAGYGDKSVSGYRKPAEGVNPIAMALRRTKNFLRG